MNNHESPMNRVERYVCPSNLLPNAPESCRSHSRRDLFAYGITAEIPECARLATILDASRFKQPGRRRVKLELAHVQAFIAEALKRNRVSLALGTALQFETTLRQRDVIGEWEPLVPSAEHSGIVLRGRRWVHGLTWADIADDMTIVKETTKTGALVAHDLKLCPLVYSMLTMVPLHQRVGPVIIDEEAGRPYAAHALVESALWSV